MKKYFKIIKIAFLDKLNYPQEILMSLLIGGFIFSGQAVFWQAVFYDKEVVNGFTFKSMMLYYLFARIISEIVNSEITTKLSKLILDGQISSYLLKPVNFRIWFLFEEFGRATLNIIIKLIIYLFLFIVIFGKFDFEFFNVFLFGFSLILSFGVSFGLNFILGSFLFWWKEGGTLTYTIRRIVLFLSGGLLPLAFFPQVFQSTLKYTPFPYIFDLPMKLLYGNIKLEELLFSITIQIFWIAILWIIGKIIFKIAIKSNESVGL